MNLTWVNYSNPVAIWWVFLVSVSILNICFWIWTYRFKTKKNPTFKLFQPESMIWFSGLYVLGCAFRSFLPRADVQRICLFDTWFSSVFVGRTVATIAELAFVTQWAIVLYFISVSYKIKSIRTLACVIVPIIFTAEIFSWYAVIRTHYIGNAIEESLWALTYFLIGIGLIRIRKELSGALRSAASFAIFGCALYVLFMVSVDVPMYVARFMQDITDQKPLLGLFDGLRDLNTRWVVTHDIQDWKDEIAWKSLYFSFAVWVSLALCYLPLDKQTVINKELNKSQL